jgi:transcriptional regulator with XRE-family HTH domain
VEKWDRPPERASGVTKAFEIIVPASEITTPKHPGAEAAFRKAFGGKEANRWEEQLHLGLDLEAQTAYGLSQEGRERALEAARQAGNTYGQRKLAVAAGVSFSELSSVLLGKRRPNPSTLTKLCIGVSRLQRAEREEVEQARSVLDRVRLHCRLTGLRRFARRAGVDPANLNRVLKGRNEPSLLMLAKLQALLAEEP